MGEREEWQRISRMWRRRYWEDWEETQDERILICLWRRLSGVYEPRACDGRCVYVRRRSTMCLMCCCWAHIPSSLVTLWQARGLVAHHPLELPPVGHVDMGIVWNRVSAGVVQMRRVA